MRLHVFLAKAGVASRRTAEKMIAAGRVRVNGKLISVQGFSVHPGSDKVEVDGSPAEVSERKRYFVFHKPRGVMSTLRDRHAEKTVADFFRDIPEKLVPAGRLDKDSTGLLLMTNDGELIHRLTHPRYQVKKVYLVTVKGLIPPETFRRLEKGIPLDGKRTAPCRIEILSAGEDGLELRVTLHEGRKREIRKMMKRVGAEVETLERVSYGPLHLGNLRPGQRRELAPSEVRRLKDDPQPVNQG